ncbi:MAG: 4Fe-4S dicluster domain-containing protein [Thermoguttaceae bacterium]|nr:4Fe-4S dicluster domain-containing protein [Thermoguttaceae bacterium]
MSQVISLADIRRLAADFAQSGIVAAPLPTESGKVFYQKVAADDVKDIVLDGSLKCVNSIKEFLFPRHEVLYTFVRKGNDVELTDAPVFDTPQLILGCRPCESASLPILDPIFAWDFNDRFFQSRRAMTTVVSIACQKADSDCFCTDVGGSPENTSGADAILYPLDGDRFEVRLLTEKGKVLFAGKTTESSDVGHACEGPKATLDTAKITRWLNSHFNDPLWAELARQCVGCGACTSVCPTCHCFDIVDEGSYQKGRRVKNWDYCQSALFTLHASGHNPRPDQGARQRQRITHKFAIYPEKFGAILCTGCGNCSRLCSAALGIKPALEKISSEAAEDLMPVPPLWVRNTSDK